MSAAMYSKSNRASGKISEQKDRRKNGALQHLSPNDVPFRGKSWEQIEREDRRKRPGGGNNLNFGRNIPRLWTLTFIRRIYTCISAAVGGGVAAAVVFIYAFAMKVSLKH